MIETGWLKSRELVDYFTLTEMWRTIYLKTPNYMCGKITCDDDMMVTTTPGRLQMTRASYRWRAFTLWNSQSEEVRKCQSIKNFKKLIKSNIINLRPSTPENSLNETPPVQNVPDQNTTTTDETTENVINVPEVDDQVNTSVTDQDTMVPENILDQDITNPADNHDPNITDDIPGQDTNDPDQNTTVLDQDTTVSDNIPDQDTEEKHDQVTITTDEVYDQDTTITTVEVYDQDTMIIVQDNTVPEIIYDQDITDQDNTVPEIIYDQDTNGPEVTFDSISTSHPLSPLKML